MTDVDCMEKLPVESKSYVECLFNYNFDGETLHSIGYEEEQDILCVGTSRGLIRCYSIDIDSDVYGSEADLQIS